MFLAATAVICENSGEGGTCFKHRCGAWNAIQIKPTYHGTSNS